MGTTRGKWLRTPSRQRRLVTLQAADADGLAALPDSLQGSATADALEAIVDLDLTPLADVEPPRGYGRD